LLRVQNLEIWCQRSPEQIEIFFFFTLPCTVAPFTVLVSSLSCVSSNNIAHPLYCSLEPQKTNQVRLRIWKMSKGGASLQRVESQYVPMEQLVGISDMITISELTHDSLLENLRTRYNHNLIYVSNFH